MVATVVPTRVLHDYVRHAASEANAVRISVVDQSSDIDTFSAPLWQFIIEVTGMRLEAVVVSGFRSLAKVGPVPVGSPTILTGHNDGGKTATLDAIAFLLGSYALVDEDRTFVPRSGPEKNSAPDTEARVEHTWVEGQFTLNPTEQEGLGSPSPVRIRRSAVRGRSSVLEVYMSVPVDPDLRNLATKKVADLQRIAGKYGVKTRTSSVRKQELIDLLQGLPEAQEKVEDWITASAETERYLPRLLRFGGEGESVDVAVKTSLNARYKTHLEDPALQGQVQVLEAELRSRLRLDAVGLCAHIKRRCPELVHVDVMPEVSFSSGFKSAHLRLARTDGEAVSVMGAGAGRARRISLAIWEWASNVLAVDSSLVSAKDVGAMTSRFGTTGSSEDVQDEKLETLHDVVIAYDEPDTHLDYAHQRKVMSLIREQCALPHVRMIIATHSMNLIDGVDIASIAHLTLTEDRTLMERLADDSGHEQVDRHLSQIAAALGLRNSVLLHERLFVGVEGPTEQQAFPVLFRLAMGMPLQSAGIAIWACNNNEGALMFAKFLIGHNRQVALVVDADSLEDRKKLFHPDKLRQYGLGDRTFMVGGQSRELECLFSDEQWVSTANKRWPRVDGLEWASTHIAALRQERKFSDMLLSKFRENSEHAPQRKPEMVYELVADLQSEDDVPDELRDLFQSLVRLANVET